MCGGMRGENTTCDIHAEITRQSEIPRTLNAAICLLIMQHCSGSKLMSTDEELLLKTFSAKLL